MNTRSGVASDATSVATRRSARCSWASRPTSASFASTSPLERPPSVGALGQVDAGRDEVAAVPSTAGMSLFDHAIRRRPPSFVSQCPDLRAREPGPPDVREHVAERLGLLGWNDELARVASEHLLAAEAGRALAGVVEEEDAARRCRARRRAPASSRSGLWRSRRRGRTRCSRQTSKSVTSYCSRPRRVAPDVRRP